MKETCFLVLPLDFSALYLSFSWDGFFLRVSGRMLRFGSKKKNNVDNTYQCLYLLLISAVQSQGRSQQRANGAGRE